jgi:hypothetical protein
MPRAPEINLYDRFNSAGAEIAPRSSLIWEVVALFPGTDGVPYAKLANTVDRSRVKTVAQTALLDRTLFVRVRR